MTLSDKLQYKVNTKTKPLGALGTLESIAIQLGEIQGTLSPALNRPSIVVFAGDHGIAHEGVSAYPQEVTFQMVLNFLSGGAAINAFCKQHGIQLQIVDAGVNFDFDPDTPLIHAKVAKGTKSCLQNPAMTQTELELCFEEGKRIVESLAKEGCNLIGLGEMGIANTSSSALIMHAFTKIPLHQCVGRGTGLNDDQLKHKEAILQKAIDFHGDIRDANGILRTYGGFEIAQMTAAFLEAYRQGMAILVDGFIATNAFLAAKIMEPEIQKNAIFCHKSQESGHKLLLEYLGADPLIDLNLRLGEGTGCALAFPLIQSAVAFMEEMASFEEAQVSEKE